ncbi:MAG TPA: helix-turn-helix domain-containing protein [bacterium]|jgi:excisionase family DNA binding protein
MERLVKDRDGTEDRPAAPQERELLTVEQAAEYLQVHKVTVYKYIRAGWLPAAKLGKVYRIFRRDVEALLTRLTPQTP